MAVRLNEQSGRGKAGKQVLGDGGWFDPQFFFVV